jgi:hypothetical protein
LKKPGNPWIEAAWALALFALRAVERTRPVAASHGEAGAAGARSARGSKDAEAVKKSKKAPNLSGKAGKSFGELFGGEPGFSRQMGHQFCSKVCV